ncbi:MAG: DUF624 domain-containing protein [Ruminococcaceae bacterium]|nr:DUF624 domain-containing protein [Oscillospiraceae bacterium]
MKQTAKHKIMGFMDFVMYTAGLNLLFLLCSLSVITVGASLTALYAGLRAMVKKEPCFQAFFSAFRKSFARATLLWIILLPLNAMLIFNVYTIWYYQVDGALPALLLSGFFALLLLSITTMIFLFYSRFEGSVLQLVRYGGTMLLSYPLRGLLISVLLWFPFGLVVVSPMTALFFGVLFLFFYFAVVSIAAIWLMNHPFAKFAREVLGMDVPTRFESTDEDLNK